ncbi:Uncharacterised protein [Bordetella pertussis]|nr:Uncharacterised protein [Bordetella pertussis]
MDTIAQCESGFALLNGDEDGSPRLSTSWPVDMFSGMYTGMSCASRSRPATSARPRKRWP